MALPIPPPSVTITVSGNDCRCCPGKKDKAEDSMRVISKGESFVAVPRSFFRSKQREREEDEQARAFMQRKIQQIRDQYRLPDVDDKVLGVPEKKSVKVRDAEALQAWVAGVEAGFRAAEFRKSRSSDPAAFSDGQRPSLDVPLRGMQRGFAPPAAAAAAAASSPPRRGAALARVVSPSDSDSTRDAPSREPIAGEDGGLMSLFRIAVPKTAGGSSEDTLERAVARADGTDAPLPRSSREGFSLPVAMDPGGPRPKHRVLWDERDQCLRIKECGLFEDTLDASVRAKEKVKEELLRATAEVVDAAHWPFAEYFKDSRNPLTYQQWRTIMAWKEGVCASFASGSSDASSSPVARQAGRITSVRHEDP